MTKGYAFPLLVCSLAALAGGATLKVDDRPRRTGEWGFRPSEGTASPTNPPAFVWRPQKNAASYEIECSRDGAPGAAAYRAKGIRYNCHCPPKVLGKGKWLWRFRFVSRKGQTSSWSKSRSFEIPGEAAAFPMPGREELLARIPKRHPRLFVRPEQLPRLRQLAQGERKAVYDALVRQCERLVRKPPPCGEPPKYPLGTTRLSEEWRKIWWGNRRHTVNVLHNAATLAFTRLLGGKDEYGHLARRLLLSAAQWDPKGSTGYRYNDEAGMPYAYYFARTYTFVNDLLSEQDKAICRRVMAVRGKEMYGHLSRTHLWRPYGSHRNRAWHFLGEVGVAFLGEIPEAAEWVCFATNVFYAAYPVWCDPDGGWHEGMSYWSSYIGRFTWWADVMRVAMDIDAYKKPYFSKVGTYAMYLQPPGTLGGGFGDLTARRRSAHNRDLMAVFAAQARNPTWQWYVDAHGGPRAPSGYIGFIRGSLPKVEAKPPTGLPTSRCFRGTGQAVLNATLLDARDNAEIVFKSSPFGTQSHGYEAQNAFLLYAFGERLLIRSGRRDLYGSRHHKLWMWHTKSVNSITVNGQSQGRRTAGAPGRILAFHTSPTMDYVAGEAGGAYGKHLKRFTRHIVFVKPEVILIFDRLEALKPSTFEWCLHAPTKMAVNGQGDVRVVNRGAACRVAFLAPAGLKLSLTDKFDPPPRPRIKLVEWHLTAQTPQPAQRMDFVTLIRPHRTKEPPAILENRIKPVPGGYHVDAEVPRGPIVFLLRTGNEPVRSGKAVVDADIVAIRYDTEGRPIEHLLVRGRHVEQGPGDETHK